MMSAANLVLEGPLSQLGPRFSRTVTAEWSDRTRQPGVETHGAFPDFPKRRPIARCSRRDVVAAFRIVNWEIRTKCDRLAMSRPSLGQVCELARRIKDQRDLVQQIDGCRAIRQIWRLMRQNRRLRSRLLRIAQRWGLDTSILIFE
jgi:hypothetical protein